MDLGFFRWIFRLIFYHEPSSKCKSGPCVMVTTLSSFRIALCIRINLVFCLTVLAILNICHNQLSTNLNARLQAEYLILQIKFRKNRVGVVVAKGIPLIIFQHLYFKQPSADCVTP